MPDEEKKEGIDLEAAYSNPESADAKADDEKAPDGDSADAGADADEEKAAADSEGEGADGDLGGLMDIFTDESESAESDAGLLDEFLEELTMDQVSEEADRLLEEFRAI